MDNWHFKRGSLLNFSVKLLFRSFWKIHIVIFIYFTFSAITPFLWENHFTLKYIAKSPLLMVHSLNSFFSDDLSCSNKLPHPLDNLKAPFQSDQFIRKIIPKTE